MQRCSTTTKQQQLRRHEHHQHYQADSDKDFPLNTRQARRSDSTPCPMESIRTQWRVSFQGEKVPALQPDCRPAPDCNLPTFLGAHKQNRWKCSHGEDLAVAPQLTTCPTVMTRGHLNPSSHCRHIVLTSRRRFRTSPPGKEESRVQCSQHDMEIN